MTAATLLLAGCTGGGTDTGPDASSAAGPGAVPDTVVNDCAATVQTGPLPEWARAGFTGDASMPHVLGDGGQIVAVIFGNPLTASRSDGVSNKILWVAKVVAPTGDLVIEAVDATGAKETRRVPGGPGPSIIDLPGAGCWHLTLTWPEHRDTMDLRYS